MKRLSIVILFIYFAYLSVPASAQDSLRVLSVSPQGELRSIRDALSIVVTFSHPMVALQPSPVKIDRGPIELDPPLPGAFRWLGTRTLAFTPLDTLPYATQFRARIPAGTTSLHGQVLAADFVWTFTTPRPVLLVSHPRQNEKWVDPRSPLYLKFNQPMSPQRIGDRIKLIDRAMAESVALTFSHPDSEEVKAFWDMQGNLTHILKITPVPGLQTGTSYQLILEKGLLSAAGSAGMAEKKIISFKTFGPLRYLGVSSADKKKKRIEPDRGIVLHFSNRVALSQLAQHIRFDPPVKIPDYYANRTWGRERVHLALPFRPDTLYRFYIGADLEDVFGNKLGAAVSDSFRTASYSPRVILTIGQGVVEADGDRRYPVVFLNKDKVRLKMAVIAPGELIPWLLPEKNLFYGDEQLPEKLFAINRLWNIPAKKNVRQLFLINLDEVLIPRKTGAVLIEIDEMGRSRRRRSFHRALLQVTHLGISAKFSPHNNVIWVTTLKDAQPVAGAKVEIRDDDNRVLWSGVTDTQGVAQTPGWKKLGIRPRSRWQRPRQWVFVYRDGDFAYTASDQGTGILPYRFNIAYDWNPQPTKTKGVIFSDRYLYRAGEVVHLKGILREKSFNQWQVPGFERFMLRISNARGEKILQQEMSLSEFGSFDFDFQLAKNAELGYYWVTVDTLLDKKKKRYSQPLVAANFRVEAFRPAEFKVDIRTERNDYIQGDSVIAFISASYLFGAPMANQNATWEMSVFPGHFSPSGHKGFVFGRIDGDDSFPYTQLAHSRVQFDKDGQAVVGKRIKFPNVDIPLKLVCVADVEGPNRQHIVSSVDVNVHPAAFYIGIQPTTGLVRAQDTLIYKVITVNPGGKIVAGKKINVRIIKRQWHSVYKAGVGGRYQWISKHVDTVVDSTVLMTAHTPAMASFVPKEAGVYYIRARAMDENGNSTATDVYFYASGAGYVAWERKDDDRIDLVADASVYQPGDTATVMVQSPFENANAIVTLEREGIFSQQVLTLSGSTPTIRIPLTREYLPNIYVSVILLKGRSAQPSLNEKEDLGRPAFKIGYVNLPVDAGSQHLRVQVIPAEKEYRPGEQAAVRLRVTDADGTPASAEVTLAVVDAGVLNLVNYQLPDPFDALYGIRPLSVQTAETRLHVVEQRNYGEKGENQGGGGAESKLMGMALRRLFKASAYWNPAIFTDQDGVAEVHFKLPDNLTTFKIMAVAQTRDARFGHGSSELEVKKPLAMQAALPRFVRRGDEFEGGVVIHNFSGKNGKVELRIQADGVELSGKKKVKFKLKNGQNRTWRFSFKTLAAEKATFRFQCRLAGFSDALQVTIPIRVARKRETVALYRRTSESAREMLKVPNSAYPDLSDLEVTLSSSALSELDGPVKYLTSYPYNCLEQRLSRILPVLVAGEMLQKLGIAQLSELRPQIRQVLDQLDDFKARDNGFSLWPGGRQSWPYITAYAVYTMTLAKSAGYDVDGKLLENALNYLRDVLTEKNDRRHYPYDAASWHATDAFILYLLTLNGRSDPGYAERFWNQRNELPLEARAFLLKTLYLQDEGDDRVSVLAEELKNKLRVTPTRAFFEDENDMRWIFHSNVRTTAMILQTLLEVKAELPLAERVVAYLMDNRQRDHWANTQENFYVFYALATYFSTFEKEMPNFEADVLIAGKSVLQGSFTEYAAKTVRNVVGLAPFSGRTLPVKVQMQGKGQLYYGLRMHYYPIQPAEAREEGIAVLKTLQPADGSGPTDGTFRAGELIEVTLQIVTPIERTFVVVDDPLPAGFEPINLTLEALRQRMPRQSRSRQEMWWQGFQHVEKRDDRVLLYADYLAPGVHTYSYLVRAITAGTFTMPATYAEEMYTPEVYGRNLEKKVRIRE